MDEQEKAVLRQLVRGQITCPSYRSPAIIDPGIRDSSILTGAVIEGFVTHNKTGTYVPRPSYPVCIVPEAAVYLANHLELSDVVKQFILSVDEREILVEMKYRPDKPMDICGIEYLATDGFSGQILQQMKPYLRVGYVQDTEWGPTWNTVIAHPKIRTHRLIRDSIERRTSL